MHILHQGEDWGWGVLTQGTKRKHVEKSGDLTEEAEVEWIVDVRGVWRVFGVFVCFRTFQ